MAHNRRLPVILMTLSLAFFLTLSNISVNQAQTPFGLDITSDLIQIGLPAIALGSALTFHTEDRPWLSYACTFGASIAGTYALKHLVRKERPGDHAAYLGKTNSFPSGHASLAFAGAAFLERRHGAVVGIPAYLVAAFASWVRVHEQHHDYWDVAAGALLGIGSACLFTQRPEQTVEVILLQANNMHLQPQSIIRIRKIPGIRFTHSF